MSISSTPEIGMKRLQYAIQRAGIDQIVPEHFYRMTGNGREAGCNDSCSDGCSQCCANGTANR
jgi:hypothetical protein